MKNTQANFWMTRPSRYLPNGMPVLHNRFYVRFYGPRVEPWGWYQASKLVSNYKEALAAFHEWVLVTKKELGNEPTQKDYSN